jgi:4,5-DOPA dioxygenase extradiol
MYGLPFLDWRNLDAIPTWSRDFDAWTKGALARGDIETLSDFRHSAPGASFAHPTVEHYTPLFVTLGAATSPETIAETAIERFSMGLSKRFFQIH